MARRVRMLWQGSHSAMVLVLPCMDSMHKTEYLDSFRIAQVSCIIHCIFKSHETFRLKHFHYVVRCELLFPESNYLFPPV